MRLNLLLAVAMSVSVPISPVFAQNWWGESPLSQIVFTTKDSPSITANVQEVIRQGDKAFLTALTEELRALSSLSELEARKQIDDKMLPWPNNLPVVETLKRAVPLLEARVAQLP